ncbi:hypothetical protein SmJEL517_g02640 [Synchytrium microbalum]|uniref:Uncharacterized protein n=1 Tax=Synchytrium microbalum TaxID=1806994 RepID=A0A507CB94_9FUNG|nr:uncharacterized protein SmJEL517_g02640 [Synchytrium microbalum]TPX34803.1 hypothetical protein SmJEL517_g02640 [Synchytrium microbalum]
MEEPVPTRPIDLDKQPSELDHEDVQPAKAEPIKHEEPADPLAYRHYHSLYPTCNRLLASKWDGARRKRHLDKLATMAPAIDNQPPRKWGHLEVKTGKKLQIYNDRLAEIERSNRQLLEKMSHIMKVSTGISRNENIYEARAGFAHDRHYYRRMRELEKLNMENQKILRRLESMGAHYDHKQWQEERLNNLVYLQNISAYPQKYQEMMKIEAERKVKSKTITPTTTKTSEQPKKPTVTTTKVSSPPKAKETTKPVAAKKPAQQAKTVVTATPAVVPVSTKASTYAIAAAPAVEEAPVVEATPVAASEEVAPQVEAPAEVVA